MLAFSVHVPVPRPLEHSMPPGQHLTDPPWQLSQTWMTIVWLLRSSFPNHSYWSVCARLLGRAKLKTFSHRRALEDQDTTAYRTSSSTPAGMNAAEST